MPEREDLRERLLRSGGAPSEGLGSSPLLECGRPHLDPGSDSEQEGSSEPKKFTPGELVCLFFLGLAVVGTSVAYGLAKWTLHWNLLSWIRKHLFWPPSSYCSK